MDLADFDFELPEALIALRPVRPRPASRLLVARGAETQHANVRDLTEILTPGDMLVFNDTRVIPARLEGARTRETAHGDGVARIEVTLIQREAADTWRALIRPAKRIRPGEVIRFGDALSAEALDAPEAGQLALRFDRSGPTLDAAIAEAGVMPLPPYIAQRRKADAQDAEDYQTVLAERPGAVAAPTAALHFDHALLKALTEKGVRAAKLTLHVGAGTFLPVKVDDIARHRMHAEWGEITPAAADAINAARDAGGRIIAVGTTALRLLESAADENGRLQPWRGETDIFIRPGYRFRIIDGLMTNFHLPRSTLFILVSALMGRQRMLEIYRTAIDRGYRFYSYGDSSLLLPAPEETRIRDKG